MIKKVILSILILVLFVEIVSLVTHTVFLPADILRTLPSFSENGWIKPHNSLLSDPVFQFEPWRIFTKEQIVHGDVPLWNNLNGLGAPFLANLQTSMFFPLQILYYLLPVTWSLFLIALFKVFLYEYFFYLYLRQNKISKTVSAITSIASFGGFFAVWLNWPQTNVFLLFPLILTFIDRYAVKKEKKYMILLPIVFFLAFLGGHPETFFLISLTSVIYSLVRYRRTFIVVVTSIIFSMFLASFLLFPFLEYLFNSYMLVSRLTQVTHQLPLYSLVFDTFPYLLGAPHLSFYKPLSDSINYQELVGGYAGLIAILVAIIAIVRFLKNEFIKTWLIIGVVSILVAYKFPVIFSLFENSIIKANANHRMSAFIGISTLMLFAFGLDMLMTVKKTILTTKFVRSFSLFLTILTCLYILSFFIPLEVGGKYHDFYSFLLRHILLILFSTFFFFLVLFQRRRLSKRFLVLGLTVAFFSQTVLFFVPYNTFAPVSSYYPKNEMVEYLQSHPGNILQVGNPSLPPNINMAYGISNVQNDDALEVASFRTDFDNAFPKKNLWRNVDDVTKVSLENFNIRNVISDYDIRNTKISINPGTKDVYPLLNNKYIIEFTGNGRELRQARLLTATYNRVNNCIVKVNILKVSKRENIARNTFPCTSVYDKMFYTLDISPVTLKYGEKYALEISEYSDNVKNSVGVVGENKMPYLDLLFQDDTFDGIGSYKKITNFYITTFKERPLIRGKGVSIKILKHSPTTLNFIASTKKTTQVKIYKTFYPGWEAYINNKKARIGSLDSFMSINVNKGENFVSISYRPKSFYLGMFVSFISLFLLTLYIMRTLYFDKGNIFYRYFSNFDKNFRQILAKLPLWYITVSAVISIFIGTLVYLFILKILPFRFVYNDNMVINWFYEFKYPKQQDYFFYILAMIVISIIGVLVWLILLNRYKKKK